MKKFLLLVLTTFSLSAFAQIPSYIPANGIEGWWSFTGNTNDSSGSGHNCTAYGGASLGNDRFGNANSAYCLDGINDYIETNDSILQADSPHSISMWFHTTDSTQTNQTLFNSNPHTLENYAFHYNSSGVPPYGLAFGLGNGLSGGGSWNIMHPDNGQITTPPTLDTWHNTVWTKDASLEWKFYFDGVCIDSFSSATNTGSQNANIRFGAENNGFPGGGANFKGCLDDIGVWDRALTPAEVLTIFQGCQLSITAQPTNQTATAGNNVQFIVGSSDSNATYQWQTDLGTGFVNISNAGQYSGAYNDTLTVSNVTATNNNQNFRCIINLSTCADTSNSSVLSVTPNGVTSIENENSFSIYPNPTTDEIVIQSNSTIHQIKILNVLGQEMKSIQANSKRVYVSLSDLSDNLYFIQINNSNIPMKLLKGK